MGFVKEESLIVFISCLSIFHFQEITLEFCKLHRRVMNMEVIVDSICICSEEEFQ